MSKTSLLVFEKTRQSYCLRFSSVNFEGSRIYREAILLAQREDRDLGIGDVIVYITLPVFGVNQDFHLVPLDFLRVCARRPPQPEE